MWVYVSSGELLNLTRAHSIKIRKRPGEETHVVEAYFPESVTALHEAASYKAASEWLTALQSRLNRTRQ